MTQPSADLSEAIGALRRAVEAELSGNDYYLAAAQVSELSQLAGAREAPGGGPLSLGEALASARKSLERLTGNQFYLAINKLEGLARFTTVPIPSATPDLAEARGFDMLAAASKARVEEVAASLGVAPNLRPHKDGPHAIKPEIIADGELERRSSEPCSMAELAQSAMEKVAAAAVSAEAIPAPVDAKAPAHLGSPSAAIGGGGSARPHETGAAEGRRAAATAGAAAPAHDSAPAAAKQAVAEVKRKGGWLGLLFGRR